MIALARRNIKLFFRDRSAVFFSLLSVLIVIGLYALFLKDTITGDLTIKDADILMGSWIMAGILSVIPITSTLGVLGVMVNDRSTKILKDFNTLPLNKASLPGGYVISTIIVGMIMSLVALIVLEIYIVSIGGAVLVFMDMLLVLAILLISVLSGTAMMLFLVSFFRSQNAYSVSCTIVGTLIGFLTGTYIPVGVLPEAVGVIIKVFPMSHTGSLLRQIFMKVPMEISFEGVPDTFVQEFKQEMGIVYNFGDSEATTALSISILLVSAILFFILAYFVMSRKKRA